MDVLSFLLFSIQGAGVGGGSFRKRGLLCTTLGNIVNPTMAEFRKFGELQLL